MTGGIGNKDVSQINQQSPEVQQSKAVTSTAKNPDAPATTKMALDIMANPTTFEGKLPASSKVLNPNNAGQTPEADVQVAARAEQAVGGQLHPNQGLVEVLSPQVQVGANGFGSLEPLSVGIEPVDVALNFDIPGIDISKLFGTGVSPSNVTEQEGCRVFDFSDQSGLKLNANEWMNPASPHTQVELNYDDKALKIDSNYSPSTGMMLTQLDSPPTPKHIEAFKAMQRDFHAANPHIPMKPLVIVVLEKGVWKEFQKSYALINANQKKEAENENIRETKRETIHKNTQKAPVLGPVNVSRKQSKTEDEKTPATNILEFEEHRVAKKNLEAMEKEAEANAAAKKDAILKEIITKDKKEKNLKSDQLKSEQHKS